MAESRLEQMSRRLAQMAQATGNQALADASKSAGVRGQGAAPVGATPAMAAAASMVRGGIGKG